MTKFVDSLGLKRLVTKIAEAVSNGAWLPVKVGRDADENVVEGAVVEGENTTAYGKYSHAEGNLANANNKYSHAEGNETNADGVASHAEGGFTTAKGACSHAEGNETNANGNNSHAEGIGTIVSGSGSHAQGHYNHDNSSFIDIVGVGNDGVTKNASVIYAERNIVGVINLDNPKNGYQYLLGVGGYQGQEIDNAKSVQEVIADLEKGVAATETMTVEDIREIMSA